MSRLNGVAQLLLCSLAIYILGTPRIAWTAEVAIQLPLARSAYQTNEQIDVAVIRSAPQALPAGKLTAILSGVEDGSRLAFEFLVPGAAVIDGVAKRTELLHFNGWLLRPGKYNLEIAVDGAKAQTPLEIYGHLRKSSFRLVNWGRANGPQQLAEGENNLGFNLVYGGYMNDKDANCLRAGMDFMPCCIMSGGHQMDLRMECDWSDPLVVRGGTQRAVRGAFQQRTRPNVPGIHFYDEPGLTWHKHPKTGEMTPHGLPSQLQAYQAAYGEKPIEYYEVDPQNPDQVRRWKNYNQWKLGFMDAAWKDSQFGVSYAKPDFISLTQSQYGFSAFGDGYYFNVVRSLPITSGHGGYHDYGLGIFNPSFTVEMARARDFGKPCWYLPTWYGNTTSDEFRLEQYLSFMTGIQGMLSPPDIDPYEPATKPAAQGVVESNKLFQRLGPIFTTMPVTRPPVALLYSMSHNLQKETDDRNATYAHSDKHGQHLYFSYLAGKLMQQQFLAVVDEDIVDGTLAAEHKAVILTSIDFLAPEVISALEKFAAAGGLVLATADCGVQVKGAVNLGIAPEFADIEKIKPLMKANNWQEAGKLMTLRHSTDVALKLAAALKPHFDKAKIQPVYTCDQPGIVASRQTLGDVEYLFAVNASQDENGNPMLGIKPVVANFELPSDGRPIYDAIQGGEAGFKAEGQKLAGQFRFGPGQMRVWARTTKAIQTTAGAGAAGGIRLGKPVIRRDYTAAQNPQVVEIAGAVIASDQSLLGGSIPITITLRDPSGGARYELYRATAGGSFKVQLPLALNDPAGTWTATAQEGLANSSAAAQFAYSPPATASVAAGSTPRAALFGPDRGNVHRFFRVHQDVTIVKGAADYHQAAAERLAKIMEPWGVQAKIVEAAAVNKPRPLTAEEAKTWVGLEFGRSEPGEKNPVARVGFAIRGPVILLGAPEENPLTKHLTELGFLPYTPAKDQFPGRGRGFVAWQRDGIGAAQESLTLVAYDAAGLGEAIGSLFEAAAGLDPLTPHDLPLASEITAATRSPPAPAPKLAWKAPLADRVVGLRAVAGGIEALTHDGAVTTLDAAGKSVKSQPVAWKDYESVAKIFSPEATAAAIADAQKRIGPTRAVKFVTPHQGSTAVAYWGGTVEIFEAAGNVQAVQAMPQDVTALASVGGQLLVGTADGVVSSFTLP